MLNLSPTKWQKAKLGDFIVTLTDYHANGSYKKLKENVELLDKPDYAVMIRTTNFEQNDFTDDLKFITREAYEFLSKSKVKPKDILMNKIANAGSVYLMPDLHCPVSLAMNLFLIRTDPSSTDQQYIYYYLKSNEAYIKGFAIGTAAATITKDAVKNLNVIIPPLLIQRRVASILSAYEHLIENNTRRIRILEEMSQRIYEEWFVRFRFPGYENVKMIDSEFGLIPDKWRHVKLSEVVTKTMVKYQEGKHDNLSLLDLARIPRNSLSIVEYGNPQELSTSRIVFNRFDILFSAIRPYLHKVTFGNKQGVTNTSVHVLETEELVFPYVLSLLFNTRTITWADKHSNGTKMPVISWDVLGNMKILFPPESLLRKFYNATQVCFNQIIVLNRKNENLRKTRDLLLPKLISGEIDVSNFPEPVSD